MTLRLGVLSDVHWCPDADRVASWHGRFDFAGVAGRVRLALERFAADQVDAVVVLGDVCHDGDQASVDAFLALAATHWTGPLLVVPGNHDPAGWERQPAAFRRDGGVPVEEISVERVPGTGALRAAAQEISATAPVALLSHYPLQSQERLFAERGLRYSGSLDGGERLAECLRSRQQPSVVLCGHVHARINVACGGLLQLTVAALVEPPCEFALVEISTGSSAELVVRRVSHSLAASRASRAVLAPSDETWAFSDGAWSSARVPYEASA